MNQAHVRVAIIGCGRIAGHHCRSMREANGVELVAVCDLEVGKASAYGKEYGVPQYQNYHEMLVKHPEINTVAVVTPSGMHAEHAMELIERYGKHIIVEKPTFMRPTQVESVYQAARSRKVQVFPVFQNRYNRAVQRVKNALISEELGEIRLVNVRVRWCRPQRYYDLAPWRGTYSMDGGALSNQGIHHLDLLRYLGGEIEEVSALMRTFGAQIEVEDSIVATMRYKSGAIGSLEVTTAARPDDFEASLSLVCASGLAQLGGIAVNELQIFTPNASECAQFSEDFSGCVYGYGHGFLYQDIAAHLDGTTPFPISEQDCMKTIQLWHAFYVSAEEGKWVKVSDGKESKYLGKPNEELASLYRTPLWKDK